MHFQKEMLLLYAVTDRGFAVERTLEQMVEDALRGGATMVQLREKTWDLQRLIEEAIRIRAVCRRYGVPLVINDRVDVALASGADGVHVGLDDTPVAEIRAKAGADFIIGATAKTVSRAQAAEAAGADYLGVGAVFPSPTKPNAVRITARQLREICTSVRIPSVAIGGICEENVRALQGGGMAGIAVVSALFAPGDVQAAARRLKACAEQVVKDSV